MATTNNPSSDPPGRKIELKDEYLDPAWKARWLNARAKYPEGLLHNIGLIRGLCQTPDAPSMENKVFIVYRTDRPVESAASIVDVYTSLPAANEHAMLLFANEYADSMGVGDCVWAMEGEKCPDLPGVAKMVWAFSPHACLSLEVILDEGNHHSGPRKIFVLEKDIESEPPLKLEERVLGSKSAAA